MHVARTGKSMPRRARLADANELTPVVLRAAWRGRRNEMDADANIELDRK
jgi:hypothetical protein